MKLQELEEIELLFCSENKEKAKQRGSTSHTCCSKHCNGNVLCSPSQLNKGFKFFFFQLGSLYIPWIVRVKYSISYPHSVIDSSILESCHSDKKGNRICLSFWDSRIIKLSASFPLKESNIIIFLRRTALE